MGTCGTTLRQPRHAHLASFNVSGHQCFVQTLQRKGTGDSLLLITQVLYLTMAAGQVVAQLSVEHKAHLCPRDSHPRPPSVGLVPALVPITAWSALIPFLLTVFPQPFQYPDKAQPDIGREDNSVETRKGPRLAISTLNSLLRQ